MDESKTAAFKITRTRRLKWLHKPDGFPELSRRKLERMRRAVIASRDPTRYIIVATFAGRWVLYHRVEDAGFGSHISMATLFKQRSVAEAVRKTIFGSRLQRRLRVIKVRKSKTGVRLAEKLNLKG